MGFHLPDLMMYEPSCCFFEKAIDDLERECHSLELRCCNAKEEVGRDRDRSRFVGCGSQEDFSCKINRGLNGIQPTNFLSFEGPGKHQGTAKNPTR